VKKIVFDSYALIAFFRKEPKYAVVRDLLIQAANNEMEAFMSSINVGELYYMMAGKSNNRMADEALKALQSFPIHFVDADFKYCMEAAALKAKYKFSYADAFAASLTIKQKATLITGDNEFDALNGEIGFKVKYL
jgi:ribonuclease VapC